jgi:hypothetical protein
MAPLARNGWVKNGLFPADAVSKTGSRWRLTHEIQNGSGSQIPDGADAVSKTGFPVRTDTQNRGWLQFPQFLAARTQDMTRLSRVVLVLESLIQLDTGGRINPRPASLMHDISRLW